jgi:hypothetical protein
MERALNDGAATRRLVTVLLGLAIVLSLAVLVAMALAMTMAKVVGISGNEYVSVGAVGGLTAGGFAAQTLLRSSRTRREGENPDPQHSGRRRPTR